MIIKSIEIEKFRSFENVSFDLGRRITAISGRNATQKTTVLGMIGQPFSISKGHAMYGCTTIDGYNFRSQFSDKFKISPQHDIIGEHRWKLNLYDKVYEQDHYLVESIARRQSGHATTLRFWNAESRARGAGYIQLPVYFLSLSRLLPIGEGGKTKSVQSTLTPEELEYCITNYRTILSIHSTSGTSSVGIEKGASSKTFAGVSDSIHDIFTNSAGEGNIVRIILAVLSFKRLKEQYPQDYKGGILLIDEIDATLYGFSQGKLVEYLWKAAGEYRIQIIFTTHSPIILRSVNKLQRNERKNKGTNLPVGAYDSSIVYLEPKYHPDDGHRIIMPKNVITTDDLNSILKDINLAIPGGENKIRVYCEDARAAAFLQYILSKSLGINLELFMTFVDINLGWTNYIQLAQKEIPEFKNNIIVLDGDVPEKSEYKAKEQFVKSCGNFLFLPLVIEKDIFALLKNKVVFIRFQAFSPRASNLSYDVCFNNWPLGVEQYSTVDFKKWYKQAETALGDQNILFDFWCEEHQSEISSFVAQFFTLFNQLADKLEVDAIPTVNHDQES